MSSVLTNGSSGTKAGGAAPRGTAGSGGFTPRMAAIAAVTNYRSTEPPLDFSATPIEAIFASNVFNKSVMKERLPKPVYKALVKTIDAGEKLDPSTADVVASAMKDWAISKGATHYA